MNNANAIWPAVRVTATALGLTIIQFLLVQAYREHKVHNIVLYPDKHSWCKTTTIKQVISYPGCTSVEIDNNVCVGACFSYSIPHTEPSDPGEVIVPYCDSCQPSETTWHQITLQCNKNDADTPSQLIKHVQIIQNCSCTPCEKNSHGVAKFQEKNDDFFLQQSADAELLDALQTRNESNFSHLSSDRSKNMHSMLSQKLITLLKTIQANYTGHDKEQLFDLFRAMQDTTKHKFKAKNIIDFIDTLQSNKTDLDTAMLSEILLKFDYSKHFKVEAQTSSDPLVDVQNVVVNPMVSSISPTDYLSQSFGKVDLDSAVKENIPIATWIQDSDRHKVILETSEIVSEEEESNDPIHSEHDDDDDQNKKDSIKNIVVKQNKEEDEEKELKWKQELQKEQKDVNEGQHEIQKEQEKEIDVQQEKENDNKEKEEQQKEEKKVEKEEKEEDGEENAHHNLNPTSSHLHLHQHHVNDNIISHGHLARGPHGALVIEPDRIHEKLDVNEHELKPNHAGTLLSYHSHSEEGNAHK